MGIIEESKIFSKISSFLLDQYTDITLSLLLIFSVGFLVLRISNYLIHEDIKRYKVQKNTKYATIIIAVLWILSMYSNYNSTGGSFLPIVIGIVIIGVTITLKGVFTSFIGWLFISSGHGFQSGQRVEIDGICGDVIDIGLLRTTIAEVGDWDTKGEQSTGRLISVPNSVALDNAIFNYTKGFDAIWNELSILITFESDWELAHSIVENIANRAHDDKKEFYVDKMNDVKKSHLVNYTYITPKVYTRIKDSGVELTLRHLVPVRQRRVIEDNISQAILKAFSKEKRVDFAYPTVRYYKEL